MTLQCEEFIRRFLLHVLPKGLMRLRHYGLLANRCRKRSLEIIGKRLAQPEKATEAQKTEETMAYPCPKCHKGHLMVICRLDPVWPSASVAPG